MAEWQNVKRNRSSAYKKSLLNSNIDYLHQKSKFARQNFRNMATIISIETSTEVCSAALLVDGRCEKSEKQTEGQAHSTLLAPFLESIQRYASEHSLSIDAVAVSCGPGSYTGLRIGVSTAKGLCFGLEKPLLSIDTLKIIAGEAVDTAIEQCQKEGKSLPTNALFCPMIDARRMEVYTAFFDKNLNKVRDTKADIIDERSYEEILKDHIVYFFGNGATKCREKLTHANAKFLEGILPLAENMGEEAERQYKNKEFKDVAYFEPFYLKEFVATVGKNKVLGLESSK